MALYAHVCVSEFACIQIASVRRREWTNIRSIHTLCPHLDDYKIIKGSAAKEGIEASLQPFKLQSFGELSFSLS